MTVATTSPLCHQKSTNVRIEKALPRWVQATFANVGRIAPRLTSVVAAELFRTTRRSSPRPGEREVLESATGSRIAGMQVWSWGEGPIVLLVHGWNGRSTQLGGFVSPLVARGHRVVAFDALGHGDSDGADASESTRAEDGDPTARGARPRRQRGPVLRRSSHRQPVAGCRADHHRRPWTPANPWRPECERCRRPFRRCRCVTAKRGLATMND